MFTLIFLLSVGASIGVYLQTGSAVYGLVAWAVGLFVVVALSLDAGRSNA